MNLGFSMFFFAVWPWGRRCANCRDAHFFERYCDESIFTWKHMQNNNEKNKKANKNKKFRPMGKVWGEAWQGTWVWTVFFFWFFHGFLQFGQNLEKTKKHQTKKFRPMGKVWAIHAQIKKTKKQKKQKTKKTKNKKKQTNQDCTPQGEGVRCRVLGLVFLFFWFFGFLVFCFFGFLVCVWIAIADVPSRDCQALSVVALEARSIHYSTAMFAMI